MYFVFVSEENVAPAFAVELLARLAQLIKDYCGILSEEAIRKNFVLIYEILDEVIDFGYPQSTSTEMLKSFVFDETIAASHAAPQATALSALRSTAVVDKFLEPFTSSKPGILGGAKTTSSITANKSVLAQEGRMGAGGAQQNEIFIDLIEKLVVVFSASGSLLRAEVEGSIKMRSFLAGSPELKLSLNEDLIVRGRDNNVRYEEWEADRSLIFTPPDGEFTLMQYRMDATASGQGNDLQMPFRIYAFVETPDPQLADAIIRVRAELPKNITAANVEVRCPVPKGTTAASCQLHEHTGGERAEYKAADKVVVWEIKKFAANQEKTLSIKMALEGQTSTHFKREIGPVSLRFDIPMFTTSNIQIRALKVSDNSLPYRWVRSITQSDSYVARLN